MTKKKSAPAKASPAARVSAPKPTPLSVAAAAARVALELQQKKWEEAVKFFGARKFGEARSRFLEAAGGPRAEVADKARAYAQMCDRRLGPQRPQLKTAEEFFTYGVERLNARDLDEARTHLEKALAMTPAGDHVLYALALCRGFSGDGAAAAENLRRAIEIAPDNRIHARQDADFLQLASQFPALRSLMTNEPRAGE